MANILGVQTVDGIYILNVDTDPSTGLGTSAPLGSFAIASDGSGFFYKSGVLNTNWSASVLAPLFGVVRYVYLVNDASDATKLGGAANNVYTTFQAAYDAANTLQVALGGLNRVIIMVGNTVAATVGNLALSSNWNTLVNIVGIGKERSLLGNITVTGVFTCNPTIINAAVGNITAEGGISLLLNNSTVGNLVTSSTTGASGNISISNSNNSTIGAINSSAILGNVGTLTISSCSNITLGNITMTQTSTTDSFSVGAITLTNCYDCRFSSVTVTMSYAASTGTIGGLIIGVTNQDIIFIGFVRISGYANSTTTASDVVITAIFIYNTKFTNQFCINNRTTGGFNNWEGGIVGQVIIQRCVFMNRTRIMYHNTTPVTTGLTFRISDCIFKGSSDSAGMDFYVQNSYVSFDSFIISNCQSNFQNGFAIQYNGFVTQTVPFTIDGVSVEFNGNNFEKFYPAVNNPTGVANSTYDVVVLDCFFKEFEVAHAEGDVNMNISNTNSDNVFYLASNSVSPALKRTLISNCNLVMNNGVGYLINLYNTPILIKNSYLSYYTNILNPLTQDIISYNSFIESFAETGSVTTWTGTLYTSTIKRLVTDDVVGLTMNNSYDEAV